MKFREARPEELVRVSELVALAFEPYPLFAGIPSGARNERGVDEAMLTMMLAETKLFMRYQFCLVGSLDDEIVAAALIESPSKKKTTTWQYFKSGGLALIRKVGILKLLKFMSLAHEVEQLISERYSDSWYVDTLAVDSSRQGQRLGSRMINDCIVPFVRKRGGKTLTLITNTESNAQFYLKNGFTEAGRSTLKRKDFSMGNWTFIKEI